MLSVVVPLARCPSAWLVGLQRLIRSILEGIGGWAPPGSAKDTEPKEKHVKFQQ